MPPVGFKPTISAGERPQTFDLDRAATGTNNPLVMLWFKSYILTRIKDFKIIIIVNALTVCG
jgi:hypothetical protein